MSEEAVTLATPDRLWVMFYLDSKSEPGNVCWRQGAICADRVDALKHVDVLRNDYDIQTFALGYIAIGGVQRFNPGEPVA